MQRKDMNKVFLRSYTLLIGILLSGSFFSCKDDFFEQNKPEWLGASIYDELTIQGNFTYYLRLIDEIDYTEVLQKTGSKTLFVADDDAFRRFFNSNNSWGVKKFEDFSPAQKRLIMNSSMINNAYQLNMLSSTEGPQEGQALRRLTALSAMDTVSFVKNLPAGKEWDPYRESGLLLGQDAIPMYHFLPRMMWYAGITNEDCAILFNKERGSNTAFIDEAWVNGVKIKKVIINGQERDGFTCLNGAVYVMEELVIPSVNMVETIRSAPETQVFNSLLERFCAPVYDPGMTNEYRGHPAYQGSDAQVYRKRFYTNSFYVSPSGEVQAGRLAYDPGWVGYTQRDMPVMFAPTNESLTAYFEKGAGKFLKDRYGSWEQVPTEVLQDFLRNHMKESFLNSIPTRFDKITDDAKDPMGIKKEDVLRTCLSGNGVVYITKAVYPPASYSSVMAPTLVNENMRIMNWAIKQLLFNAYLLSMDSYYSFIVPTDEALQKYVDPVTYGKAQPEVFKFWYNTASQTVSASVFKYDKETGAIGDSIRLASTAEIENRMEDILDYHIIVGNIEGGKEYYMTKGGGTIRIKGKNAGMNILGGADVEQNTQATVSTIYDQTKETNGRGNGKTYVVDKTLQAPFNSVYQILSTTRQFSEFFNLLAGNEEWTLKEISDYEIFYSDPLFPAMDYNVKFFSRFHYTIYVPSNEKVRAAIDQGRILTWDQINAISDEDEKTIQTKKLIAFLRYHFQDNAVYIDGAPVSATYETATLNPVNNRFFTLSIRGNGTDLFVKPLAGGGERKVIKSNGLYNLMARDYKFTPTGSRIETSAFVVIHEIDDVLFFE